MYNDNDGDGNDGDDDGGENSDEDDVGGADEANPMQNVIYASEGK